MVSTMTRLENELIENGFTVDADGDYISGTLILPCSEYGGGKMFIECYRTSVYAVTYFPGSDQNNGWDVKRGNKNGPGRMIALRKAIAWVGSVREMSEEINADMLGMEDDYYDWEQHQEAH